MLFIEIEGKSEPRFQVEFHPRVTVVSYLSPIMRERLVATFSALLGGDLTEQAMSLDAGNGWEELSHEMLDRLGLSGNTLPFVISAADLPGVRVVKNSNHEREALRVSRAKDVSKQLAKASVGSGWELFEPLSDGHDVAPRSVLVGSPLYEAQQAMIVVEDRVNELNRQLQALREWGVSAPPDEIVEAYELIQQMEGRIEELEATARFMLPRVGVEPAGESKVERLERLRQIEAAINERLLELQTVQGIGGVDTTDVQACIEAVNALEDHDDLVARRERLARLLLQYETDRAVVRELEAQPRPPEWLLTQTQDQMSEAHARITAFTYQIEEGIDVRRQLRKAQEQLREAQEAWEELENGIAGALLAAKAKLDVSTTDLRTFLQLDPGIVDVIGAARAEQQRLVGLEDPRPALIDALGRHGVKASFEHAVAVATRWVAAQGRLQETYDDAQAKIIDTLADLDDCRAQLEEVEADAGEDVEADAGIESDDQHSPAERGVVQAELRVSLQALEEARKRVAEYERSCESADIEAEIARMEALYEEARAEAEAAGRKVDYYAKLDALRPADVDETEVDASEIEKFLLSRAAGLRKMAGGEAIPLVLDATFDDFDQVTVSRLLTSLGKISSMVQVIYLSSGDVAEWWLQGQDEWLAAQVFARSE